MDLLYLIFLYGCQLPQQSCRLLHVEGSSAYRPGNGKFLVENIDPMLCTHIIYAYAGLDNVTHSIQILDSNLDTEEDGGRGNK
jgi:chitinase